MFVICFLGDSEPLMPKEAVLRGESLHIYLDKEISDVEDLYVELFRMPDDPDVAIKDGYVHSIPSGKEFYIGDLDADTDKD